MSDLSTFSLISSYIHKLATLVEGDPKACFSMVTTLRYIEVGATPFPGLLHFILDMYHIILSVKQGGIKFYFCVLGTTTWDLTQVSRAIGEHSTH